MRQEKLGGLDVCIAGGIDREGGGEGPLVVLLHGFGAPGDDLVSLWRMIEVPDPFRFVFPVGPLTLDVGYAEGRAWWMLDMDGLARDQASGRGRDVREVPIGLSPAREKVVALLDELEKHLKAQPEHMILGGFSQGAMLACDVVLRTSRPFAGLVMMSGTLIAKDEWESLLPKRKGLPVFQSHGNDDPLLPIQNAQQLRDSLIEEGLQVEWHEFRGSHEIPPHILQPLSQFIRIQAKFE